MAMPLNLIFVRHGESEGNVANRKSRNGDDSLFTSGFLDIHSSEFRLTKKGRQQATLAGQYIRENISLQFNRYYTSEYIRAMETAYYLALPQAVWFLDINLRERDYGAIDVMPESLRKKKYAEYIEQRKKNLALWLPPSGESIVEAAVRGPSRIINTIYRECADQEGVIIVSHGEILWGARLCLERMPSWELNRLLASKNPVEDMHNCQILHYSRKNPQTGEIEPYLNWFRSICPWNLSLSDNSWKQIIRPTFTNEELMAVVNKYPRHIEK